MNGIPAFLRGKIINNREVVPRHYLMQLLLPAGFTTPAPGQFVMVRGRDRIDPLLGRPLSIYGFERAGDEALIELFYRLVGKGTQQLALLGKSDSVEVLGPLGTPFSAWESKKTIILVAGGIGIAPLMFLARHLGDDISGGGRRTACYLGTQSSHAIVGLERLERSCSVIRICTDDGSRGVQCPVTELVMEDLVQYDPAESIIYACGPLPMIGRLAEILRDRSFPCQVSMEQRMACGVGACLGCVIEVKDRDGRRRYERVCREGPVFDIRAITWQKRKEEPLSRS